MWVLAEELPKDIQVILKNLKYTKFYKVYNMKNQYIGKAKIEDIQNHYMKEDRNVWIKRLEDY